MRIWEEHRYLIMTAGGVLVLWLVTHLVFLGPQAAEAKDLRSSVASEYGEDRERFFPDEAGGVPIRLQIRLSGRYHGDLSDRLEALDRHLSRPFPDPLYPPEKADLLRAYVRSTYQEVRERILRAAGSRGVAFGEQARLILGSEPPEAFTESREQDESWLRQLILVEEFVNLALSISDDPDGGPQHLLRIARLAPKAGRPAGPHPAFFDSYPLGVTLVVSLPGLVRLVDACGQSEHFLAVRSARIRAAADVREARRREHPPIELEDGRRLLRSESLHYYLVELDLERIVTHSLEKAKEQTAERVARAEAEARARARESRPHGTPPAVY